MSSFPETVEEFEKFFKDIFEACGEQEKSTGDFQQGPNIPEVAKDRIIYGDQMTDPQHQINHYGQTTFSRAEDIYRGQLKILGGENTHHGYQTAVYKGYQNLSVDPQVTSPIGGQPLYDWQMQTPGFKRNHHGSNKTNSSEEENLFQSPETTASFEDTFYFSEMMTTTVDENVCPGQKRSPNVEGSHSPQRTSCGNQTPYVGGSTYPSSSFLAQIQPLGSFSVSPSGQGQLPQETSDPETLNYMSQKKDRKLKQYFCSFQNCDKAYTTLFHLKDHVRKHTGEKPYVCKELGCSWTFFRSVDLKRHQSKHSGERPYFCATCNKNFSRLWYLKKHQMICSGSSPNG
ncbi:Kruppel-like factor 18 [Peromyscus eremicus]|uniref:Kruppel-like factor 18 n=1 Tax=Peromyscus eremicus TaxID=42410 RepID=UPI0027DAD525|nr:Kruppel-like factor 18 [Peromyscus eremicus]